MTQKIIDQELVDSIMKGINSESYDICNELQGTIVIACPKCSHNVRNEIQ